MKGIDQRFETVTEHLAGIVGHLDDMARVCGDRGITIAIVERRLEELETSRAQNQQRDVRRRSRAWRALGGIGAVFLAGLVSAFFAVKMHIWLTP